MTNIIQMPDHVPKAEQKVVQVDFSIEDSSTKLKEKNSSKISGKEESSSDKQVHSS